MSLIWRLLRQHINIFQLAGFFLANLFGMGVIMLGIQFYKDVVPLFTMDDAFDDNFIVISKHISTVKSLSGSNNAFKKGEIEDIRSQSFCVDAGEFTSSQYKVNATMGLKGSDALSTEMFFEAVPDQFVDNKKADWSYTEGSDSVPVIIPSTYIALYNFGFAQSRGLPKVSNGLVGMIEMKIRIKGDTEEREMKGKVIGFSSRLNTILVPMEFITWSNKTFAPEKTPEPTRLILKVNNPTDDAISLYMNQNGYEVEDNKLDAAKATYFLKIVITLVLFIGLLISALSFYILMLSIYLLVQKNSEKLQNLLLIGYSPSRVSLPYQLLTIGMNAMVLILAILLILPVRGYYMKMIGSLFPEMVKESLLTAIIAGIIIFILVSVFNIIAIRLKINKIWRNKK